MKQYDTPEMIIFELKLVDVITNSESDDNPVDEVPGGGNNEWV